MPPLLDLPGVFARTDSWHAVRSIQASQWSNPNDTLSVLLLFGSDIVQRAVAQQADRIVTPVAFSFGWVAYAASALLSAFGDGSLMPDTDVANTLVIGAESGHQRTTKTWILGRILRDADNRVDSEMQNEKMHVPRRGRHAVVIKRRPGSDLDLEILALSTRTSKSSWSTRIVTTVLAVFWTALLITVAGLKKHTWYLICIGLVGSIQNLHAAAVPRHASALGVHLDYVETVRGQSVASLLKVVEQKHPFVGTSLLPVFSLVASVRQMTTLNFGAKQRKHAICRISTESWFN